MSTAKLNDVIKLTKFDAPGYLKPLSLGLLAVGLAGFIAALMSNPDAAWRAFLSNYFFWFGLGIGGMMWSVVMRITGARWGRSLMRLAEGAAFYLPIAFVLFFVLLAGANFSHVYEWAQHHVHHKEVWLDKNFVFARTTLYMVILFGAAMFYLYHSLKSDVRVLKQANYAPDFFQRFFSDASGSEEEWQKSQNILLRFSPVMAMIYGVMMSLLAFDLLMSLEPHWYSTMFGGYIFMANMLMGMAFIGIICATVPVRGHLQSLISKNQFWDVGKLMAAFATVWTYLTWSQYLPIWYGNMPEETGFVLKRTHGAYENLSWTILSLVWIIPFWMLLPKNLKWKSKWLATAGIVILCGLWLLMWMIVIPSQFPHAPVNFAEAVFPGWIDGLTNLMFAGLFLLAYNFFLKNVPILAVGDRIFQDVVEHGSHKH